MIVGVESGSSSKSNARLAASMPDRMQHMLSRSTIHQFCAANAYTVWTSALVLLLYVQCILTSFEFVVLPYLIKAQLRLKHRVFLRELILVNTRLPLFSVLDKHIHCTCINSYSGLQSKPSFKSRHPASEIRA